MKRGTIGHIGTMRSAIGAMVASMVGISIGPDLYQRSSLGGMFGLSVSRDLTQRVARRRAIHRKEHARNQRRKLKFRGPNRT